MKRNGKEGKVVSPEKGLSLKVGQTEALAVRTGARSTASKVYTLPVVGVTDPPVYTQAAIEELEEKKKYAAVYMYQCTLNLHTHFAGREGTSMPMEDVFSAGRLKGYEEWLVRVNERSWNMVSMYMWTLRAAYDRTSPLGSMGHDPKLLVDIYTKVEPRTKRALTGRQAHVLMNADFATLPEEQRRVPAYFLLMFLFRGTPFIDPAHPRKKDMRGGVIVHQRHKTGRQITVRVPKEAVPLMKRSRRTGGESVYLFPVPSEAKEEGGELYRSYLLVLREFNEGLTRLTAELLPGAKVSSYTARRTWVALAYYQGMSVGIISEAMGHSSVRAMETYLKPFGNRRIDRENNKLISSAVRWKEKGRETFSAL